MKYYIIFYIMFISIKIYAQNSFEKDYLLNNNNDYNGNPFTNIIKNTTACFSGKNAFIHLAGFASTYAIINTGIDYKLHNFFFRHNDQLNGYAAPAVGIGYLAPAIIGGGLFAYGKIKKDSKITAAGNAALQAALISVTYISLLKAITGRPNPDSILYHSIADGSSRFQFGLFRNGIHYGWPSGHLGVNTAVVTSLIYFYKENNWIKLLGGMYLGYLVFGVAAHDGNTMHWSSDIFTGLLIGYVIGSTVGNNFRDEWNKTLTSAKINAAVTPVISNNYTGINLSIPLTK